MGNWLVLEHVLRYSRVVAQTEVVITELNSIEFHPYLQVVLPFETY
jgi:hypothetical protein